MTMQPNAADETEDVESFRQRARAWLAENMPPVDPENFRIGDDRWERDRRLQRTLWDGGFAGICFPREYGGLGLSYEHQRAFTEESTPYQMPFSLNVPTLGILAATLVDVGTHEQKLRHLPAILRGEEVWVQFLSEPTGGSDLAGSITRAERDGDVWILTGSKIWTSACIFADYGMVLARTNWDVPKHRGLTMFILKVHQPGVQIERIRQADSSMEFCQEFFDDVAIPADHVLGEVDDGWSVASRLLIHERTSVGGASKYTSGRSMGGEGRSFEDMLVRLARETGQTDDAGIRRLVAEGYVLQQVSGHLGRRVAKATAAGKLPPPAGSILKLFGATTTMRRFELAIEIAGSDAVAGDDDTTVAMNMGNASLARQGTALGGGSNEIQRNIIAERVLGMPREWAADRDVAFRDVRKNTMPTAPGGAREGS